MKPGMLGPWLLAGYLASGDETHDELHYIRNWTIWLDLNILLRSLAWALSGSRELLGNRPQDEEHRQ
jgi:lipopolysaccharide/colanic/teichoic acid biosynthesis glycosyltransferase